MLKNLVPTWCQLVHFWYPFGDGWIDISVIKCFSPYNLERRKKKEKTIKEKNKIKNKIYISNKSILYLAFCCVIYNRPTLRYTKCTTLTDSILLYEESLYTQDTSRYIKIYLTEIHREEVDL